jgi:hypothetical protein
VENELEQAAEKDRIEQKRQFEKKRAWKKQLLSEYAALQAELPTLKGLFAGKRRREIQRELERIEKDLDLYFNIHMK